MPLHVARLRDSDLAAEEKPEACWYAVLLWAASWHQLPAGSLPDNDAVLTKLIGLGRDVRTFRKHKEAAMRGFVLCDDGRLYHPVVAEQAVAAWDSKLQQRWRTECARIKKANQRTGANDPAPTFEEFMAGRSPLPASPSPQNVPEDIADCPEGQPLQETGTGTGKVEGEAIASLSSGDDALPLDLPIAEPKAKPRIKRDYPPDFEAAWKAYPHFEGRSSKPNSLAQWRKLPAEEQAQLSAAIGRFRPNVERVCGGKGAPDMAVWLKDGKHLNWQAAGGASPAPAPTFNGPPELRSRIASDHGEPFAATYIDTATWDGPHRLLIAANAVYATKLKTEAEAFLLWAKVRVVTPTEATRITAEPEGAAA